MNFIIVLGLIKSLNINLLDVEIKEYACFEMQNEDIHSLDFISKIRNRKYSKNLKSLTYKLSTDKNIFYHRMFNKYESKTNFFCVELSNEEIDLNINVNNIAQGIDFCCEHIQIFFPFSYNHLQFTENGIMLRFNTEFIRWKAVLYYFIKKMLSNDLNISSMFDEILIVFDDGEKLDNFAETFPLLFFENNLNIFIRMIKKIQETIKFDFNSSNNNIINSFRNDFFDINNNRSIEKYFNIYGYEKNEEYLNFIFFMLITDVTNILQFFLDKNFKFKIYSFSPLKKHNLAKLHICFKISLKKFIFEEIHNLGIIGNNNIDIELKFFFDCDDFLYFMVDKQFIDLYHIKTVKIVFYENKNYYESNNLNLEEYC